MKGIKLPQPISGGLLLSYKCSAECQHCMYACSPEWEGDWISEEELGTLLLLLAGNIRPSSWGPQAVSLNQGLHFTGGEPFLNFPLLVKAVEIAEELKIPSTFVETNCFWSKSDRATRDKLTGLRAAGLKGILISVNPFYAEYVPFERTERCIRISQEVFGSNVMVYQQEFYHLFKALGIKDKISRHDFAELTQRGHLAERVELFLMGRAARQLRASYPTYPPSAFFGQPCLTSFLRNWHNHFDNYGNFIPGYCGGVSLGGWHNLEQLTTEGIDLETHPILRFLIVEDVKGLLDFAKDFGYQESQAGYVSKCDLCLDLRKHLVSRQHFQELSPLQFYQHLA